MNTPPPTSISPAHKRRLTSLFMRMRTVGRDDARSVTREELRGTVAPNGQIRDPAIVTGGDVEGDVSTLKVVGIEHHPIATGNPANGDGLVYQTADSKLHWAPASGSSGPWEPVTNGDPDFPDLIFEDGDIVMELVP